MPFIPANPSDTIALAFTPFKSKMDATKPIRED
jgi:hypothetical protein